MASQNLTQTIVHELGKAIVTNQYSADNPFPIESDLCEQFDVSRTILREAVKMLTAKGLLTARPRRGTQVLPEKNWNLLDPDVLNWHLERKFSLELLAEFAEIRNGIEPMAAELAAINAGVEDIAAIEVAIERMESAETGEDDPLESDIAFHIAVLRATGNRFFLQFDGMIKTALKFSIRYTNRFKGVQFASVADHKKVYKAILRKNPKQARKAMEFLTSETLDIFHKAIDAEEK